MPPVKSLHVPSRASLGVGISASAEFERFYSEGFPTGTPFSKRHLFYPLNYGAFFSRLPEEQGESVDRTDEEKDGQGEESYEGKKPDDQEGPTAHSNDLGETERTHRVHAELAFF